MAIQQLHYCTNCGVPLVGFNNFCQSCGNSLRERPPAVTRPLLSVVSPTQANASHLPSWRQRAGAAALDGALTAVGCALALGIGAETSVIASASNHPHLSWSSPLALALAAIVAAGYHPAWWAHSGRTPGMRAFGLALSQPGGAAVSLWRSLGREAAMVVSALALGAGFWSAGRDPEGRGWHDRLAGTVLSETEASGR